jgi:hypothetical protein
MSRGPTGADSDDPVASRLQRLIDDRRRQNEAAAGKLDTLGASWDEANRRVGERAEVELALADAEVQAADRSRRLLDENLCPTIDGAFTIAGKVIDAESKLGLPGLRVQIDQKGEPSKSLGEGHTNQYGNFTVHAPSESFDPATGRQLTLTFLVFAEEKEPVHREDQTPKVQPGQVYRPVLAIDCGDRLSNRLEAARAVRESVEGMAALATERLAEMKSAREAVTHLAALQREGLRALRDDLATAPPDLPVPSDRAPSGGPAPPADRPIPTASFVVRGRVVDEQGRPVEGLMVSAFDRDVRFDDKLGAALTDREGAFEIGYIRQDFRETGEIGPDLFVTVKDSAGRTLFSSAAQIRFDAIEPEQVYEITIQRPREDSGEGERGGGPPPAPLPLESIPGIAKRRAERLRKAGIADARAFVEADDETLRNVLGDVPLDQMKADAKALLERGGEG